MKDKLAALAADGWRYEGPAVEPDGERWRGVLVFAKPGDDRRRYVKCPQSYRLEDLAWEWCAQWSLRVVEVDA